MNLCLVVRHSTPPRFVNIHMVSLPPVGFLVSFFSINNCAFHRFEIPPVDTVWILLELNPNTQHGWEYMFVMDKGEIRFVPKVKVQILLLKISSIFMPFLLLRRKRI